MHISTLTRIAQDGRPADRGRGKEAALHLANYSIQKIDCENVKHVLLFPQLAPMDESGHGPEEDEDEDIKADLRRAKMRARATMEPPPAKQSAVPTADLLSMGEDTQQTKSGQLASDHIGSDESAPQAATSPMRLGGAPEV